MMMPTAFLSHGAPDRVLSKSASNSFLRGFANLIPRPIGIVIISAHWQTKNLKLTAPGKLLTQHDFYGFSHELQNYRYNPQQTEALSQLVVSSLESQGEPVTIEKRGLDHGSWSVLSLAYPEADIPIANLSLPKYNNYSRYISLGKRLADLRKQGILIIGSGSATHNLAELALHQPTPLWSHSFVKWLQKNVNTMNLTALADFYQQAPHAKRAHPTPEHFLPLLIVAGAAHKEKSELIHDSDEYSALNNSSFLFGDSSRNN